VSAKSRRREVARAVVQPVTAAVVWSEVFLGGSGAHPALLTLSRSPKPLWASPEACLGHVSSHWPPPETCSGFFWGARRRRASVSESQNSCRNQFNPRRNQFCPRKVGHKAPQFCGIAHACRFASHFFNEILGTNCCDFCRVSTLRFSGRILPENCDSECYRWDFGDGLLALWTPNSQKRPLSFFSKTLLFWDCAGKRLSFLKLGSVGPGSPTNDGPMVRGDGFRRGPMCDIKVHCTFADSH